MHRVWAQAFEHTFIKAQHIQLLIIGADVVILTNTHQSLELGLLRLFFKRCSRNLPLALGSLKDIKSI